MNPAAVLSLIVRAETAQAQAALARTQATMRATAAGAEASSASTAAAWSRAGSRMQSVGKTMTTHIALPAAAVGAASVKMAMDFHEQMHLVETQAGETAKNVDMLGKRVQAFAASGQTQYGPQELAKSLYEVESAGIHGARAMDVLKKSSDLAMVGQADLESTTKALAAAQNTGIDGAQNLDQAIGTLNATVGAGQMRMDDLVSAMGTGFLASAKQMGLNLSEVGAALAEMTKQGVPATAAATRLRMALTMMGTISTRSSAAAAIEGIGIKANELGKIMQTQGLIPALQDLRTHLEGLSKVQQTNVLSTVFGGARSGTGIMMLVNNLGDLSTTLQQVHTHSNQVGASLAAIKKDPSVQLKIIWAQIQASMVKVGDALLPVVRDFAGVIAKLAAAFASIPSFARDFILGAIVLGPMIRAVGMIGSMVGWVLKLRDAYIALAGAETIAGAAGLAGGAAGAAGAGESAFMTAARMSGYAGAGAGAAGAAGGLGAVGTAAVVAAPVAIAAGGAYAAYSTRNSYGETGHDTQGRSIADDTKISQLLNQQLTTHRAISREEAAQDLHAAQALQQGGNITKQQQHQLDVMIQAKRSSAVAPQIGKEWMAGIQKGMHEGKAGLQTEIVRNNADVIGALSHMTTGARSESAKSMVAMANELALKGKIPIAAAVSLRKSIESTFPGLEVPGIRATQKLATGVAGIFQGLQRAVSNPLGSIESAVQGFLGGLHIGSLDFSGIAKAGANAVSSVTHFFAGGQQKGMAQVAGSGTGDSVPVTAILEPGEVFGVFNRNAAPYIDAMNEMFPRFATGGVLDAAGMRAVQIEEQVAQAVAKAAGGGPKVQRMIAFGKEESAKHMPYVYGGGHGGFDGPYDCSGFVSAILHAGGLLGSPITTDGLKNFGEPGPGRSVTIGVRGSTGMNAHTMMQVGKYFFESGGSGGGAHTDAGWDGAFPIKRHPRGMMRGGVIKTIDALRDIPPELLDPSNSHFLGWGLQKGGTRSGTSFGPGRTVGASFFGGPHDPSTPGHTGYRGDNLAAIKWAFAELNMGHALGGLPLHDKLLISNGGRKVVAEKADIGAGGGPVSGHPREIDLWWQLANALNVAGTGLVTIQSAPHNTPLGPYSAASSPSTTASGKGAKTAATGLTNTQIKQLPIPGDAQKALMDAMKNQDTLSSNADMYAEFAQRASNLGVTIAGLTNTDWLKKQLGELTKLRNKLVTAHNVLVAAIEKLNEQLAKLKGKKGQGKNAKALTALQQAATAQLSTVTGALGDVQGLVADPSLTFALVNDLESVPLGTWGGKIGDVIQALHPDAANAAGSDATSAMTDLLNQQALATIQRDYTALQEASVFDTLPQLITGASGNPFLGGYADGGQIARQGFALVGERGPEIASFPVGTSIGNLGPAPSGGVATPDIRVEVHGDVHTDGRPLEDAIKVHVNNELAKKISIARRTRG